MRTIVRERGTKCVVQPGTRCYIFFRLRRRRDGRSSAPQEPRPGAVPYEFVFGPMMEPYPKHDFTRRGTCVQSNGSRTARRTVG